MTDTKPIAHVIDDDLSVGKALARLLKSMDYRYEIFTSAEDFLNRASKEEASFLLLDIKLPGMSGEQLQMELKKRAINIPIIFITGHGEVEIEKKVLREGAHGYLEKPFDDQLLLDLIETAIAKEPNF